MRPIPPPHGYHDIHPAQREWTRVVMPDLDNKEAIERFNQSRVRYSAILKREEEIMQWPQQRRDLFQPEMGKKISLVHEWGAVGVADMYRRLEKMIADWRAKNYPGPWNSYTLVSGTGIDLRFFNLRNCSLTTTDLRGRVSQFSWLK
jgi:hypothetical protein